MFHRSIVVVLFACTLIAVGGCAAGPKIRPRGKSFLLLGKFDLDNTGRASHTDRGKLESYLTTKGGTITTTLTAETNYVVLGERPRKPQPLPEDQTNPILIARHKAAEREHHYYQMTIDRAQRLPAEVIDERPFLEHIGYATPDEK